MANEVSQRKVLLLLIFRVLLLPVGVILFLILFISYWERHNTGTVTPNQQQTPPPVENKGKSPPKKIKLQFEDITFQENFFFGSASSTFQTTGGDGNTDWNVYINQNSGEKDKDGKVFIGPSSGTDFFNRYKEDYDLAGEIGIQVHRLSLEWSCIEPEEGKFSQECMNKYLAIFSYMKSRGIDPMICLNHFALPLWFVEKGGWESNDAAYYYSRYAHIVAAKIGKPLNIKWWLTFNEPQMMLIGYTKGVWPPNKPVKGIFDAEGTERALFVASHLIDAHRLSYRLIHKIIGPKTMVGFASAPGSFYPEDSDSTLDQIAYNIYNSIDTLMFDYAVGKVDRDFIGLNYYGRTKLKLHISLPGAVKSWLTTENPVNFQWYGPDERKQGNRPKEFEPRALYELIMKFKDIGLPIVITENGLSDDKDEFREEFITIHLKAIHDAMRDGANIIGYQYWALTDTWEWDGSFSQMGLVKIDRDNHLDRQLRSSALTYGEIIKSHKITKELLEKHKELLN